MNVTVIEWLKPRAQMNPLDIKFMEDYRIITRAGTLEYQVGMSNIPGGVQNADMEILIRVEEEDKLFDELLEYQNETSTPTFTPHPDYPEFKIFRVKNTPVKRDISELITEIKNMEAEANNTLIVDGQFNLANIFYTQMAVCLSKGGIPCENMINSEIRFNEIAERVAKNRATAKVKIAQATNFENYILDSDWERDTLTPLGTPFNEL